MTCWGIKLNGKEKLCETRLLVRHRWHLWRLSFKWEAKSSSSRYWYLCACWYAQHHSLPPKTFEGGFLFFCLASDRCKSACEIFLFHKWHFLKWTLKPFSPLSFLIFPFFHLLSRSLYSLPLALPSCPLVLSLHLSLLGRWVIFFLCRVFFFFSPGEENSSWGKELLAQLELKALIIVGESIFQSVSLSIQPPSEHAGLVAVVTTEMQAVC